MTDEGSEDEVEPTALVEAQQKGPKEDFIGLFSAQESYFEDAPALESTGKAADMKARLERHKREREEKKRAREQAAEAGGDAGAGGPDAGDDPTADLERAPA
eukprot:gene1576-445_t